MSIKKHTLLKIIFLFFRGPEFAFTQNITVQGEAVISVGEHNTINMRRSLGQSPDLIIIGKYNTINLTQVIGTSQEYHELKNRLNHLDSTIGIKTRNCSGLGRDQRLRQQYDRCRKDIDTLIAERAKVQALEQTFRDEVTRMAESFSNIELNSERLRQAMNLFKDGKIREADAVLSTEPMLREAEQRLSQYQKFDSLLRISAYEFMLKAQITAANDKHPFRYDSADWFFRQSLRYKEDCQNLTAYADFLQFHKKSYEAAIQWYEKGLVLNDLAGGNALCAICCTSSTPHHLGMAYEATGDFARAGEAYDKGLQNLRQWAKTDSTVYEVLANNLYRVTYFYNKQKNYARLESVYGELLEIYHRLSRADSTRLETPATYQGRIAKTRVALADLYRAQKDYTRAEAAYLELLKANPKTDTLSEIREKLAALYHEQKDYARAEVIYREILADNPKLGKQFKIQEKLTALYREQKGTDRPESAYLELLKVYVPLAKATPQAYEHLVVKAYANLGRIYLTQKDYASALPAFNEALEIYLRMSKADPPNYEPWVALTKNDIGLLLYLKNDFAQAEATYGEALCISFHLPNTASPKKELVTPLIWKNLKTLYRIQHDFTRAEAALEDSLKINEQEKQRFSDTYEKRRLRALLCLINLYEVWVDAKPLLEKALIQQKIPPLYETLSKNYPDNEFITCGWPQSLDDLAWYHLFDRQFTRSEAAARAALQKAPGMFRGKTRLAHALLLQGKYAEAQKIYQELAQATGSTGGALRDLCLDDLDTLEHEGITHEDIQKVRAMLQK